MIRSFPPVVTFVQDDAIRPRVILAQMGKSNPKIARSVSTKRGNSPPNAQFCDLPSLSASQDCQFAQSQISSSENKPQRKTSFRLTR
jgi:hypothetical protein